MNIAITFRHMAGSDAVRTYAEEKVAKLQKFLRQAMTAHVTIAVEGLEHIADVRISAGGVSHQANERSADMYASIDAVIDKLERQIRDGKGHSLARKRGGTRAGEYAADILQMAAAPATSARSRS